jgi:hypothetical protein
MEHFEQSKGGSKLPHSKQHTELEFVWLRLGCAVKLVASFYVD